VISGTEVSLIIGQTAALVTAGAVFLKQWRDNRIATARRDHTDAKIAEVANANAATAENVKKIEVATNHMKDALVASTAKASHAEGLAEGKAEERRGTNLGPHS
jgi:hypothetical protein